MRSLIALLGLGAAAGLNAYATLLVLGGLVRLELVPLDSPAARFFAQTWVLALLATLYVIEFVADKVPAVEHAWNALHTFVRPLAGAAAAVAVVSGTHEGWVVLAAVLGGTTALLAHTAKTGGRVVATVGTGGTVNPVLSLAEDAAAFGGALLAAALPWVLVALVAGGLLIVVTRRRRRAVAG